jgi:hypothetical protein
MTLPHETRTLQTRAGSLSVEIRRLAFRDQKTVLVRLTKALGPTLAAYADAHPSLASLREAAGPGGLSAVVNRLLTDVTEADLDWLAEKFGPSSTVLGDGKRTLLAHVEARDAVFTDHGIVAFGRWLVACLEVNFSDFFGELRGLLGDGSASSPTPG